MPTYPRRLPHIVTRADWVALLIPTYAAAQSVDPEEAQDRLERAVHSTSLLDELYAALGDALAAQRGPRTNEDEQLDKLSAGVQKRRSRVRAVASTPEVAAALVRIDLETGIAPSALGDALETPKGAALLRAGMARLCTHLTGELLK